MATNKIVDKTYLERQFRNYHKTVVKPQIQEIEADITTKVDKVAGYSLSKNDLTDALKSKLDNLTEYDDTELSDAISDNADDIATLNGSASSEGSVGKMVNDRIVQLIGGENVSKDTLGKVSTWISGHVSSASDMEDAIEDNSDDIEALQQQQAAASYEMENEDLVFTSLLAPITITGASSIAYTYGGANNNAQLTSDISGVTWSSNDTTVATVSSSGVVTALQPGTVTITASKVGFTAATKEITIVAQLVIEDVPASAIELPRESIDGTTVPLTLKAADSSQGTAINDATWSSSNDEIATVSNGTVTLHDEGTVTITATKTGYAAGTCEITISATEA